MTETATSWERTHGELYSAKELPGGGQLEIRMRFSADHPDPDILHVARQVKIHEHRHSIVDWFAKKLGASG